MIPVLAIALDMSKVPVLRVVVAKLEIVLFVALTTPVLTLVVASNVAVVMPTVVNKLPVVMNVLPTLTQFKLLVLIFEVANKTPVVMPMEALRVPFTSRVKLGELVLIPTLDKVLVTNTLLPLSDQYCTDSAIKLPLLYKSPVKLILPFTSNVNCGAVDPIPTLPPVVKILPTVLQLNGTNNPPPVSNNCFAFNVAS